MSIKKNNRFALQVTHDYISNSPINYISSGFPRLSARYGWAGSYLSHTCADSVTNKYCLTFESYASAMLFWQQEVAKGYLSIERIAIVSFSPEGGDLAVLESDPETISDLSDSQTERLCAAQILTTMNIQFNNRQFLDLLVYLTEEMRLEMTEALHVCQLRQKSV